MQPRSPTQSIPGECQRVAVCGLGKVGSSLALALHEVGIPLAAWDRDEQVKSLAADLLPRESVVSTIEQAFAKAPLIILSVSDEALPEILCPPGPGRMVVHTSGIHPATALKRCRGHRLASWHPLRSFPRRFEPPGWSRDTLFTAEGDDEAVRRLRQLTKRLSGRFATIASSAKPLYHAAAALIANHSLILAHDAERLFIEAGMTPSDARHGLTQLLASACKAFARSGGPKAITGPLARGDEKTIALHLEALAAVDPGILQSYAATALDALAGPGILSEIVPEAKRSEIRRLLEGFKRPPKGESERE